MTQSKRVIAPCMRWLVSHVNSVIKDVWHFTDILYCTYSDDKHQCDKPVVVLLLNDDQHLGYICYLYAGAAYTLNLPCFMQGYYKISSLFHVMMWNYL